MRYRIYFDKICDCTAVTSAGLEVEYLDHRLGGGYVDWQEGEDLQAKLRAAGKDFLSGRERFSTYPPGVGTERRRRLITVVVTHHDRPDLPMKPRQILEVSPRVDFRV